ncbi:NIPSNAP family containing protein [Asanoa ishikariensis]|uniref:NIPSNAP protein n=1 Tax=Asanoa ishikariensis TaxID=137265 RepID=A0A1H3TBR2_9ACTN|nr:NIPSNAP family protein [Asanoa ishikariensis]GIF62712.1 NIPSNAP family containing protein [Asanoa ishikariensis]SDZ47712.1 NIPSNAP protein [Asanoa ishikariensis]
MTIVELRQYTLVPGGRDTLITLFDANFVESQEAEGMRVVGQFRDLDRPDRFVWVREFSSMAVRQAALTGFYSGPVWKEHRDAANATMLDSDNVLLMRAIEPFTGYEPRDAPLRPGRIVVAGLCPLAHTDYADHFDRVVRPGLGATLLGTSQTSHEPNTFPALPVREGEDVFVWFARVDAGDVDAFAERVAGLDTSGLAGPVELLRLAPTTRSALR